MAITLAQAIRNAIEGERAAEKFYLKLAAAAREDGARAVLRQLAREELEHAEGLALVARRLVDGALPERADMPVAGIEDAPALVGADGLEFAEALAIAVEAEESAALYYDGLASSCTGAVAEFFGNVRGMEERHAERVRALLGAGGPRGG